MVLLKLRELQQRQRKLRQLRKQQQRLKQQKRRPQKQPKLRKRRIDLSEFICDYDFINVSNVVLSQFLGICPFLGVSKKVETAAGMGAAVTFVITIASAITYPIYYFILVPLGLAYLETIAFILIIAALVQFVEMVLK